MTRILQVRLAERSYPIHLLHALPGPLLAQEACRVRQLVSNKVSLESLPPVLVVSDKNVAPLYGADVLEALSQAGFRTNLLELEPGEKSKDLDTVKEVLDHALAFGIGRKDLMVALGGGVVGDITGFAAAILHRGVNYLQVPTTLLAQVDSEVGGKTGVTPAQGKNLIGAFWQPRSVVSSQAVLVTLPERERRCGLAEAVKHAFIADADLSDWCVRHAEALRALEPESTEHLVEACCRIKADVVATDERESGYRTILNFGHTFGHAYERLLGYGQWTHGEAISLGMVWAAGLSERLGVAPVGLLEDMVDVLKALGLPTAIDRADLPTLSLLLQAARSDKKADGDTVRFVLLKTMGQTETRTLDWGTIENALDELLGARR
jgi:3-dehydroquinate synthase